MKLVMDQKYDSGEKLMNPQQLDSLNQYMFEVCDPWLQCQLPHIPSYDTKSAADWNNLVTSSRPHDRCNFSQ